MESIYNKIGLNIRKLRKEHKLTQENLAELSNISFNFLGQIERGTKKASLETIQKISEALKVPVSSVFSDMDKQYVVAENNKASSYGLTNKLSSILKSRDFLYDLRKIIIKHSKNIR